MPLWTPDATVTPSVSAGAVSPLLASPCFSPCPAETPVLLRELVESKYANATMTMAAANRNLIKKDSTMESLDGLYSESRSSANIFACISGLDMAVVIRGSLLVGWLKCQQKIPPLTTPLIWPWKIFNISLEGKSFNGLSEIGFPCFGYRNRHFPHLHTGNPPYCCVYLHGTRSSQYKVSATMAT